MTVQPWDRQPQESAKAFSAFSLYLEAGLGRSLRKVAQELGKSLALIARWSARHDWVRRALEFDTVQAQEKAKQLMAKEIESRLRRSRHGELVEATGVRAIQKIATEVAAGTRELSVGEAAQLASVGSRMDREAVQSAPGVQVNVGVQVEHREPPPEVPPQVALRMALAFAAMNAEDEQVRQVCMNACSAMVAKEAICR